MKKDKFVKQCAKASHTTIEDILESHTIVKCKCGADDCPGWKAVYKFRNVRRSEGTL